MKGGQGVWKPLAWPPAEAADPRPGEEGAQCKVGWLEPPPTPTPASPGAAWWGEGKGRTGREGVIEGTGKEFGKVCGTQARTSLRKITLFPNRAQASESAPHLWNFPPLLLKASFIQ